MAIPKAVLEDLEKRRAAARAGGGTEKQEARRKKGLMTARERIEALYQPGTFQEWGMHANHDCHHFGMEDKTMPGDGVVTGTGIVDGRVVAAFSQDFTV
ncbi:MAG TPA: carboxyl transferase domain-containing protein, partial [Verrucomicrobiae bacterium]|nr:carboxyl transferase domain-containing protein [Verrucomicrobiae bacterium]